MSRPPKYRTAAERAEARRASDRRRRRRKHEEFLRQRLESISEENLPVCCAAWYLSSPYRGKRCLQHQQWSRFAKQKPFDRERYRRVTSEESYGEEIAPDDADSRIGVLTTLGNIMSDTHGVRVHPDPDSLPPLEQARRYERASRTWSGRDPKLEREADELINSSDDQPRFSLNDLRYMQVLLGSVVAMLEAAQARQGSERAA